MSRKRNDKSADANDSAEYRMRLEFSLDDLEKSDYDLGVQALDSWYRHVAERSNGDFSYPPSKNEAELLRQLVLRPDGPHFNGYKTTYLVAVKMASLGYLTASGGIYRGFLLTRLAQLELGFRINGDPADLKAIRQLQRAEAARSSRQRTALKRRVEWARIGRPIRERHPHKPDIWIAEQILRHAKEKANVDTVRRALRSMNLQKKSAKM